MKSTSERAEDSKNEENRIRVLVQQMLVTRIFAASYIGRFYVESLKAYRDVIRIFEEEKDFMKDLEAVKNRLSNFYKRALWTSVTGPHETESGVPEGCCIWVKLENVAFGSYWFMIEDVSFPDTGELVLKVKVIRNFEPDVKTPKKPNKNCTSWDEIKMILMDNIYKFGESFMMTLQEIVTWDNVKESSKFMFLLLMTIATVFVNVLQYLGDYSIKFFREFNNLIKALNPIFIAIIDLILKTIGGFFLLIAMMWRGHGPVPHFPALQAPPPSYSQFRRIYNKRPIYQ